ncbi:MAG: hypothetical protein PHG00_09470 [Methylococcales bacterium]|nr:hypothetical protein [Methylococcales bacterium]
MDITQFEPGETYTGRLPGCINSDLTMTVLSRSKEFEEFITVDLGNDNVKEIKVSIYGRTEFIRPWIDHRTKPVFYARLPNRDSEREHFPVMVTNRSRDDGYRPAKIKYR